MNLSAKTLGQLAISAIALFFFSCSDETSIVGYKNPIPKFRSSYVEIPVTTSVLLFDSVRTSNIDAANDVNRFLVGKYNDPLFGPVTSTTYAQYLPTGALPDTSRAKPSDPKIILEFESIQLDLFVDFYLYGSEGVTTQKFSVYPLTQDLQYWRTKTVSSTVGGQQKPVQNTYRYKKYYHAESTAAYDGANELGTAEVSVDAATYKSIYKGDSEFDSTFITVDIDDAFGQNLFNLLVSEEFHDDYQKDFTTFTDIFKGLAIVPTDADKIIGISVNSVTRLRMTYIEKNTDGTVKATRYVNMPLGTGGLVSFNSITHDFTGTPLEGLTTPYQDFDPGDDMRYIAAGSRIVTKIDFSKFIDFAHSDTISQMAINSAEFEIKNIDASGGFDPPTSLVVRLIEDDNHLKKLAYPGRSTQYSNDLGAIGTYQSMVNFDYRNYSYNTSVAFDSAYTIINDLGGFLTLNYSSDDKTYSGTSSLFFQQLFQKKEGEPLFTKAILLPYAPSRSSAVAFGSHTLGKTLNRVAFNKDNIVLKIYYTVPTVNQNQ